MPECPYPDLLTSITCYVGGRSCPVACTVVLGMQWGDEGKGKIVDWLARDSDIVARFQGGANAGHTVNIEGRETILHQLPTGILNPRVLCLIGNGVVLDPDELFEEIELLEKMGLEPEPRLRISPGAHLLLPYHKALDRASEDHLGPRKIGTTCRGIGPAYTDKVSRRGVRLVDLADPDRFVRAVGEEIGRKQEQLSRLGSSLTLDPGEIISAITGMKDRLLAMMEDVSLLLDRALEEGRSVLLEGAQGTMLDLDHGTYPFVTSSNTTIGAAIIGLGIPPGRIDHTLGVVKAYTTRVGMGPFPTELEDEVGTMMRERGKEYGATTGRPRRCGWLDAVVARHAARINGVDSLVLTKMDVLDSVESIDVCVAYRIDGERCDNFPRDPAALAKARPVYERFDGWMEDTTGARNIGDLPAGARRFIGGVGEVIGRPVEFASVGPSREALVRMTPSSAALSGEVE